MIDIPLSQFPQRLNIRLGIKGSKGKLKVLHDGARVHKATKLTILLDPLLDVWNFSPTYGDNSIILTQDNSGEFTLEITSNITILGREDKPIDDESKYLEVVLRGRTLYVPL